MTPELLSNPDLTAIVVAVVSALIAWVKRDAIRGAMGQRLRRGVVAALEDEISDENINSVEKLNGSLWDHISRIEGRIDVLEKARDDAEHELFSTRKELLDTQVKLSKTDAELAVLQVHLADSFRERDLLRHRVAELEGERDRLLNRVVDLEQQVVGLEGRIAKPRPRTPKKEQ